MLCISMSQCHVDPLYPVKIMQKQGNLLNNTKLNDRSSNTIDDQQSMVSTDPNSFHTFQGVIMQGLSNLAKVLQNWKDGHISKQEKMDIIIASTNESIKAAETNKLLAVDEVMKNKLNQNDEND